MKKIIVSNLQSYFYNSTFNDRPICKKEVTFISPLGFNPFVKFAKYSSSIVEFEAPESSSPFTAIPSINTSKNIGLTTCNNSLGDVKFSNHRTVSADTFNQNFGTFIPRDTFNQNFGTLGRDLAISYLPNAGINNYTIITDLSYQRSVSGKVGINEI